MQWIFDMLSYMSTGSVPSAAPLYVQIAQMLSRQVASGTLRPGDRVPSLRKLSEQKRVSITTALQAYIWLENRGYLEARPQSGFYVRTPFAKLIPEPQFEENKSQPIAAGHNTVLGELLQAANDPKNIPFGYGCASPELFPNRRLNLILRHLVRQAPLHSARYDFPPGVERLRRQISRQLLEMGCEVSADEIVVTSGGLDAVNLGLRAVAKPGDVIAVESPTYFGILESIASLNMKVLEIPTHPQGGMDLDELERAIRKHQVKASVVMTNCHNPLGYVLSDKYKRALVELTGRAGVPVIEDDLYGDLTFEGPRPYPAKAFDRKGLVLHCGSYSKVLSPGYRVGWVAAGRFRHEVERLKLITSVAVPSLSQQVIAEFLESGGYARHIKRLRSTLAGQVEFVRQALAKYFPEGSRISRPAGGYMLWVELPSKINALKLYRAALEQHISILPGTIFSATGQYRNHIRINCGISWSDVYDKALLTVGKLCERI
jgi:DNA-binding transcriptional MocR family regulator